jgi:hypothetical protein
MATVRIVNQPTCADRVSSYELLPSVSAQFLLKCPVHSALSVTDREWLRRVESGAQT